MFYAIYRVYISLVLLFELIRQIRSGNRLFFSFSKIVQNEFDLEMGEKALKSRRLEKKKILLQGSHMVRIEKTKR